MKNYLLLFLSGCLLCFSAYSQQDSALTIQKMTAAGEHFKKGDAYYQKHLYVKAATEYVASFNTLGNNSKAAFKAACAFALAGKNDTALYYLDKAVAHGYLDFTDSPDLNSLHNDSRYKQLVAKAAIIKQSIKGQSIKPVFIMPPGYNPQNKYPLLVGFHAFNSSPESFGKHWKNVAARHNCILMLCRGTKLMGLGKFAWNKNQDEYDRLMDEIDMAKLRYPIKKNDIVFVGYADGAYIAYALGAAFSEKIKGIIPLDGAFPTNYSLRIIKNKDLKIFSIVGKQDNAQMVNQNITLRQRFVAVGIPFKLTLLDIDHQFPSNEDSLYDAALKWILND